MKIPTPPWYKTINEKLEGTEWLVDALLIIIIVSCIYFLVFNRKNHVARVLFTTYLISP